MNEPCNVRAVMKKAIEHLEHDNIMGTPQRELVVSLCEARAAVAELIEADHEYEAARRDWDHVTAHDPEETSDETWRQVADRYEAAVMRRAAALARVGGA